VVCLCAKVAAGVKPFTIMLVDLRMRSPCSTVASKLLRRSRIGSVLWVMRALVFEAAACKSACTVSRMLFLAVWIAVSQCVLMLSMRAMKSSEKVDMEALILASWKDHARCWLGISCWHMMYMSIELLSMTEL